MESSKIAGYVLLLGGLLMIFYSLYSSYQIFTGKNLAPEIFSEKEEAQKEIKVPVPGTETEVEVPLPEQLQKILAGGFFPPKIFNLISWSIWTGILIFGGGKVSSLGIKLIK